MPIPGWVPDSVFYQIFPDRFANGDPKLDPPNIQPWGSPPTLWGFQGGDFPGIIQHFDYLKELGVNAIYLNPIFLASSNHRYNTSDYYKIDPRLGDMTAFKSLLNLTHQHGMHVILDGVFNHCGRGFFAFTDLLENEEHSPYLDWFITKSFPLDAYSPGAAINYEAWWKIKSLPKFNTKNKTVRNYLFDVGSYWIEQGADGWRLDVPNEIDDDAFWEEFRSKVKKANPDAYLLGEIWTPEPRWANETHFDGLINYPFREALINLMLEGETCLPIYNQKIDQLLNTYSSENILSMYNPVGTHDTERILTRLNDDIQKVKLAVLIQFTFPGVPGVFYGDETGLDGGKDPQCRKAFNWDQSSWNKELLNWTRKLIQLRKQYSLLRRGTYENITLDKSPGILAFTRRLGEEQLFTVINVTDQDQPVDIPANLLGRQEKRSLKDILSGKDFVIEGNSFSLLIPANQGLLLI